MSYAHKLGNDTITYYQVQAQWKDEVNNTKPVNRFKKGMLLEMAFKNITNVTDESDKIFESL